MQPWTWRSLIVYAEGLIPGLAAAVGAQLLQELERPQPITTDQLLRDLLFAAVSYIVYVLARHSPSPGSVVVTPDQAAQITTRTTQTTTVEASPPEGAAVRVDPPR